MSPHLFLVCVLLVGNVLLRTFTNGFNVLPKILNIVDIPLVGLICLLAVFNGRRSNIPRWSLPVPRRLAWFVLVLFFGSLLNLSHFFAPAALSQGVMLLTPLALFVALVRLPFSEGDVATYSRWLKRLIVLEVVIGACQLPGRIASGDSEAVHGTFPGNAEQYAAFLMVGVYYLLGLAFLHPRRKRLYLASIVLILILNLSIDNKASWLGTVCSLAVMLAQLVNFRSHVLRWGFAAVGLALVALFVTLVVSKTSRTLYKIELLVEALRSGRIVELGKVKAYVDIARSHFSQPHMLLVGSGAATFYSRGCRQFFVSPRGLERMYSNPNALSTESRETTESVAASDSMGSYLRLTTREPYYARFYGKDAQIYAVGSIQVDSPYSPYAGLVGETGILGTLLYLSCYLLTLRQLLRWIPQFRNDPRVFPLLLTATGLMVYMLVNSIYGPFLETTRMTTLLWSFVGVTACYANLGQRRTSFHRAAISGDLGSRGVGAPDRAVPWH